MSRLEELKAAVDAIESFGETVEPGQTKALVDAAKERIAQLEAADDVREAWEWCENILNRFKSQFGQTSAEARYKETIRKALMIGEK